MSIIIPSDSESDIFEKDLVEVKRSILEARLNVGERSNAEKMILALYFVTFDKYDSDNFGLVQSVPCFSYPH